MKIYMIVLHPLSNIYSYIDINGIRKSFRALLYYVRLMALLGTSGLFMKNQVKTPITAAPLVLILPVIFIIKKLLKNPEYKVKEAKRRASLRQRVK